MDAHITLVCSPAHSCLTNHQSIDQAHMQPTIQSGLYSPFLRASSASASTDIREPCTACKRELGLRSDAILAAALISITHGTTDKEDGICLKQQPRLDPKCPFISASQIYSPSNPTPTRSRYRIENTLYALKRWLSYHAVTVSLLEVCAHLLPGRSAEGMFCT